MGNAIKFLSETEQHAVVAAVETAEKKTSAEIVCALSTESGRYDRAEALGGLAFGLLALSLLHFFVSVRSGAMWHTHAAAGLGWQCLAVVIGYIFGSVLLSYSHPLRRFFTSESEMEIETERAAAYVFNMRGLHRTAGHGGLLLYLSIYEHRMVIRSDDGVMAVLGQEAIRDLCQTALEQLRRGKRAEAFIKVIEEATGKLEKSLPVKPDDKNELPNHFLVFHPRP
ncbi:MAG: hypothetical protein ACLFUS_11575 [Candidatus Sumerlaeia bacterium]